MQLIEHTENARIAAAHAEGYERVIAIREKNAAVIRRYISIYGKYFTTEKRERALRHLASVDRSIAELRANRPPRSYLTD